MNQSSGVSQKTDFLFQFSKGFLISRFCLIFFKYIIAKKKQTKYTSHRELLEIWNLYLLKGLGPLWTNFPPW
jgi:hypothetical protein